MGQCGLYLCTVYSPHCEWGRTCKTHRQILRWPMVLATLVLLCAIPQMDDTAKVVVVNDTPAVVSESATKDSTLVASALPSAPVPKMKADVEPITPNIVPNPGAAQPFLTAKPVFTRPRETPAQRKIWYGLVIAGHSEAAFDAWSTHRAVAGG